MAAGGRDLAGDRQLDEQLRRWRCLCARGSLPDVDRFATRCDVALVQRLTTARNGFSRVLTELDRGNGADH